ncbi:hypothetical protein ACHAXM_005052, partial [Skeletonema potamos]
SCCCCDGDVCCCCCCCCCCCDGDAVEEDEEAAEVVYSLFLQSFSHGKLVSIQSKECQWSLQRSVVIVMVWYSLEL